ncbi:MAG: porphobilinogen synthase [Alphaproteobacteria bacterium]|nr:porphobilinogen synthase [Alphaproteobacteria bacterium]
MSKFNIGKFPSTRLRRLRMKEFSRRMVSENKLCVDDLIWPLFVCEGNNVADKINSMPGVFRFSIDNILKELETATKLKISAVAIFPQIDSSLKDENASQAIDENNLICRTIKSIKKNFPDLGVICDVALDPFTNHGHDGLIINDIVDNDATLAVLEKQALAQVGAGCDIIAPSDMMDGRVGRIRNTLDANNFHNTLILSYAAKYASKFYGPFRDAISSSGNLKGGSKSTYQMDIANSDEALREVALDINEGADMVMIKPGMPYLDIIQRVKSEFKVPTFAYQVSGEYSMIRGAIDSNWLDSSVIKESLLSFKRAGADGILTYFAKEIAEGLNNE